MNIQIDGYNFLTLLISLITLLVGYYSLIANRPRIFLKAEYINNNINNKDIPDFNWNFNIKFINYGERPAFHSKLFYSSVDYFDDFLNKVEGLDFDEDSSSKSCDESLSKKEQNYYQGIFLAKVNSLNLYQKNKTYLYDLFNKETNFIDGKSYELKKLGIGNKVSEGGLKIKNHRLSIEYKDLRDLNIFLVSIFSYVYICIYLISVFNGLSSFLPYIFACISDDTGFFFNLSEYKYIRTFREKVEINIEPENQFFEYDEYLNKLEDIKMTIQNINIFNEKIYETWENNLTKSEYKIFKKYRLKYGDNVDDYVELYKNVNEEIPNQKGLQIKLWNLIQIFYEKNAIDRMTYVGLNLLRNIILK